jgi:hypothetical protein
MSSGISCSVDREPFRAILDPFLVHFWARFYHRFSGRDKLNRIRLLISVASLQVGF